MTISVICAWLAVVCLILTVLKFIVKKNKRINLIFRKIHIPAGTLMIVAGLIHGLLAGNAPGTSLGEASIGAELFSLNTGTVCFILVIALGLSYCFRKQLKRAWFQLHRVLTVILVVMLVIHLILMGITLPDIFRSDSGNQPSGQQPSSQKTYSSENTESADSADSSETSSETSSNTSSDTSEINVSGTAGEQLSLSFSGAMLNDGTYTGSADGFKGTIKVSVTVKGGAVTSVDVVSQSETPKYWSRAKALLDTIVSEQSLEVDAVSGATFSSKGILCAVYDALEEAVIDGELQITIPQVSGRRH